MLAVRGLSVQCVLPAVPYKEMLRLARKARPRFIGFSCATRAVIPAALTSVARLRDELHPNGVARFLLSGFALRSGVDLGLPSQTTDVEVVRDLEFFDPFLQLES
jgi:hypothetical protein